jgi:hypothetical protein
MDKKGRGADHSDQNVVNALYLLYAKMSIPTGCWDHTDWFPASRNGGSQPKVKELKLEGQSGVGAFKNYII